MFAFIQIIGFCSWIKHILFIQNISKWDYHNNY